MASPKTLTIQYMVLFSHLTVQLPAMESDKRHQAQHTLGDRLVSDFKIANRCAKLYSTTYIR